MSEEEIDSKKKSKTRDITKMSLSELKELHEKKTAIYWKIRNELNEISKLIQNKGGY